MRSKTVKGREAIEKATVSKNHKGKYSPEGLVWLRAISSLGERAAVRFYPKAARTLGKALIQMADEIDGNPERNQQC